MNVNDMEDKSARKMLNVTTQKGHSDVAVWMASRLTLPINLAKVKIYRLSMGI